jgi:hypothetical protein
LDRRNEDRDMNNNPPREPGIPLLHGPLTPEEQAAIEQKRQDDADKKADAAYKERQLTLADSANKLTSSNIGLTWVLAVFTGLAAAAGSYQGCMASRSADAAKNAANTAACALAENKRQFDKNLEQLRIQTSAQVSASETAIEAFRTDERAFIEIEPFKPTSARNEVFGPNNTRWFFEYELFPKNAGKTVAYDIEIRALVSAVWSPRFLGDDARRVDEIQKTILRGRGIPKNARKEVLFRRVPKVLGPGVVSTVPYMLSGGEPQGKDPNSAWYDFLIGRIDYRDAFSVPHWMTYCFYVNNARGEIQYCREGNDQDHNPEYTPPAPKK